MSCLPQRAKSGMTAAIAEHGHIPMRAPSIASVLLPLSFAALSGCIDNDRVRVQSFLPGPEGTFSYSAQTNTVMSANDDGAAEQIGATGLPKPFEPMECAPADM